MIIADLDRSGPPLYTQVYRSIRKAVLSGELRPNDRLPATRELAEELGVSRNTILQAYEQLLAEGYLEPRTGSGTYVAARIPDEMFSIGDFPHERGRLHQTSIQHRLSKYSLRAVGPATGGLSPLDRKLRIDFRYGVPNLKDFPAEEWRSITAHCLRRLDKESLVYSDPAGYLPLRKAIVQYVREYRGIQCDASDVTVVSGSQQAIDIVARALIDPGDTVLMENPTYPGARLAFQAVGAKIQHVRVDDGGLDVERVMRLTYRVKLAYVTPSHQFPTGGIMMLQRRLAFLQWAHDSEAFVLEDDYDSEYRYGGRPIEAIQALDTYGQVIYSGTFSKILAPSMRLGYVISPPSLTPTLQRIKSITDRHVPLLGQQVLAKFIATGQFERHMRRSRARNDARRQALLKALEAAFGDSVTVQGENAGLHVVIWFREQPASRIDEIVELAGKKGIGVYSIAPFFHGALPCAGLLLGYNSLDEIQIKAGINALAQSLH